MADRITRKHLDALAQRLNTLTGSPDKPYSAQPDGSHKANPGNFHISGAYGGWCLHRMSNTSGGVTCPIVHGHIPARQLYDLMHAYIRGYDEGYDVACKALGEMTP